MGARRRASLTNHHRLRGTTTMMNTTKLRYNLRNAEVQRGQAETLYQVLEDALEAYPGNERIADALANAEVLYQELEADVLFIRDQARAEGIDL